MASFEELVARVAQFPTKPGVYIMHDIIGTIIYVGKAVNLRNRVRSYFQTASNHTPKVQQLVAHIHEIEFIVTDSELEALILECTLIKKHRPHYNVRLKDEKRYPFIRITWQEDYPRIGIARRIANDGARYFGPYTSSWAMRETLDLLRSLFPYRTCDDEIGSKQQRACLYYHIGRCPGPCIGAVNREQYRELIDRLCLFLEGKSTRVLADLRQRMAKAAEAMKYEQAAVLRDQIKAVEQVIEHQKMVSSSLRDHDVIAFAKEDGSACVQVFFIREGYLVGRDYFVLEGTAEESDKEVVSSFLQQFYSEATHIPQEVIVASHPEESQIIESWLKTRRGHKVAIHVPQRGEKKDLLNLAKQNATETLATLRAEWEQDEGRAIPSLDELKEALGLAEAPARIECYDISNIQGTNPVGSMVVFVKGVPRKSEYRRFGIRTVKGANDFAMMKEVIQRRFVAVKNSDPSFTILPDLLIVDGGRGQLNAALEAMREAEAPPIPIIGLAKEHEEIYKPDREEPFQLAQSSQGLFLLQRIRDEAHRFAVQYHRKLRSKAATHSALDDVPDIGPKRRKALLKRFGYVGAIKEATIEEIMTVPGMTRRAAESLKQNL